MTDTESVLYNGLADGDDLTISTPNAHITPGVFAGSGTVAAFDAASNSLLGLSYENVNGNVTISGATAVIQGTSGDDHISVSAAGIVTVSNSNNVIQNTFDASAFTSLLINGLGGDDTIDIAPSGLFGGGVTVIGGEPSQGSDTVNVTTPTNSTIDFSNSTITGVVGGSVSLVGVETLNVNGVAATANAWTVNNYGAVTDVHTLNLNPGGDASDTIDLNTTGGPDTIRYTPLSATSATIERLEGGPVLNVSGFTNADDNLSLNAGGNVDAVQVVAPAGNDAILVTQGGVGTRVTVTAGGNPSGGVKWVPLDFTSVNSLEVDGGAGNDRVDVDNSNGLVNLSSGITVDGGDGADSLQLIGSTAVDTDVYTAGPAAGSGNIVQSAAAVTQSVFFKNLEPVLDLVTSAVLTVNASNGDNAINYTQGSSAANGLVSIDNQETLEFSNKTALTINAGAGDDTINLNNATTPTGLASIAVNSGDPTASDTLIVNGRVNTADIITYTPATTTSDTGSVAITGLPIVNFTTTERLVINGQNGGPGGAGDLLTIATNNLSAGQTEILTPGSTFDSGHVDFRDRPGGSNPTAVPVDFLALGVAGSLTFTDVGRFDNLIYNGTALNDNFTVDAAGQVVLNTQIPVNTSSINSLTLAGLSGDDTFNVAGNHNLPGIAIEGGDPSASDVVNFTGDGTGAVTVDLGAGTIQEAGFGAVGLSGVEVANLDTGGNTLTVNGTAGADTLAATPTGANARFVPGLFGRHGPERPGRHARLAHAPLAGLQCQQRQRRGRRLRHQWQRRQRHAVRRGQPERRYRLTSTTRPPAPTPC